MMQALSNGRDEDLGAPETRHDLRRPRLNVFAGSLLFIFVASLFRPSDLSQIHLSSPAGMLSFGWLDSLLTTTSVAGVAITAIIALATRTRPSKVTVAIAVMALMMLGSTLLSGQDLYTLPRVLFPAFSAALLFDLFSARDRMFELINVFTWVLFWYLVVNLVTMFAAPEGLYAVSNGVTLEKGYWFLGWQKTFGFWAFPALLAATVRGYMKYGRFGLLPMVLVAISAITFIRAEAQGNLAALIIAAAIFLLTKGKVGRRVLRPVLLVLATIAWFIIVVLLRLQERFASVIVDLLGKDLTLTGRTEIWDSATSSIEGHLVFGLGQEFAAIARGLPITAHSNYLNLVIYGGLLLLAVFIGLQLGFARDVRRNLDLPAARAVLAVGISMFVLTVTETSIGAALYLPIIMAAHLSALDGPSPSTADVATPESRA